LDKTKGITNRIGRGGASGRNAGTRSARAGLDRDMTGGFIDDHFGNEKR